MRLFSLLSSIINQGFSFIEIEISANLSALFFILPHPPPSHHRVISLLHLETRNQMEQIQNRKREIEARNDVVLSSAASGCSSVHHAALASWRTRSQSSAWRV